MQKLNSNFERLTTERDKYKSQLEQEKQTIQRLIQELRVEIARQRKDERDVTEKNKKMRSYEQKLIQSQNQEAAARNDQLMTMKDQNQAETNLYDAQLALDEAEKKLKIAENAQVKDPDAIDKAHNNYQHCLRDVNQLKTILDNCTRVLAIREKCYLDAQTLVNSTRQEHQEAKDNLTQKEKQLANQKEKSIALRTKIENQKITINEVNGHWNRLSKECKQVKKQIKDKNDKECKVKSDVDKETKKIETLKTDVESMNQSIEKFEHMIQQSDNDLSQLKEQSCCIEQQYLTKQDENRQKQIQLTSKLDELKNNEQQIQQQQNMIDEQNVTLQRANNNMENIRTNIAKISRSLFDLEDDLAEQQQLLRGAQKQQGILDEEHNKIQAKLLTQQREKQQHENDINHLSRQINEQQHLLNQKQETLTDLQSQINQKRLQLNKTQEKYNSHKEQFDTTQLALKNTDKQIISINTRKHELDRHIERKINEKKIIKDLVDKKKIERDNSQENLKRVTNTYDEKNKQCNAFKRIKNNFIMNLDQRRIDQTETNKKLEEIFNRLTAQSRTVRRLATDHRQVDMTIRKNLSYEQMNHNVAQEAAELNNLKTQNLDQYECWVDDELIQKRFA
ncbi:unnamed protein product [Rotaria sp. Silwood2]|nr:unnamed protein product [Rotaria sp. Silwood2]CAF3217915.1 unnamed protein product [Rotaria sp. Silwood2]CAF4028181.1 unnamed protein product [Rotaria sp. Silwood2]CAF4278331.1 unnamed protein product [Rotaria sp. Silwood2]